MAAKSESASAPARFSVPRWVFPLWMWLSLPPNAAAYFGCRGTIVYDACRWLDKAAGDTLGTGPMTLTMFLPQATPVALHAGLAIGGTIAGHWAVRRFMPERVGAQWFALFVTGWIATGWLAFVGFLYLASYR